MYLYPGTFEGKQQGDRDKNKTIFSSSVVNTNFESYSTTSNPLHSFFVTTHCGRGSSVQFLYIVCGSHPAGQLQSALDHMSFQLFIVTVV